MHNINIGSRTLCVVQKFNKKHMDSAGWNSNQRMLPIYHNHPVVQEAKMQKSRIKGLTMEQQKNSCNDTPLAMMLDTGQLFAHTCAQEWTRYATV